MALYSFCCLECGVSFDKIFRPKDGDPDLFPPMCPECGGGSKKTLSPPAPAQWVCSKGSL